MKKLFSIFIFLTSISCHAQKSLIEENVLIKIYLYEEGDATKASAMPEINSDSELMEYRARFEYLLINESEIHLPSSAAKRTEIWNLYPDTIELKRLYLKQFSQDKKLANYFNQTNEAITKKKFKRTNSYSVDEIMEVASKFFYCDLVLPDTTVQAHVCIGLNGITEANWNADYTLLEAFCYEAIFNDFENDSSSVWDSFSSLKTEAVQKYKSDIKSLDQFLTDVKLDLFSRMKNDVILKEALLAYYELNKTNLGFKIHQE